MASIITRARGRVLFTGTRPPSEETADSWLIRLRWVAVIGMLITTLVARRLVPALPTPPLLATVAAIAALNAFWMLWMRRRSKRDREHPPYMGPQIVMDVLALSVVLWFAGGVDNPFAVFLTFQIVLAGLLCTSTTALGVTGLTLIAVGVLSFATPLPLASAPMGPARVQHIADLMAVAALSGFSGFFVFVFVQRMQDLRRENERNEKLAMLGRLVGGMSHELNTPLATILLASRDLVMVGRESANPEMQQLAQTIADESQRAADIIGLMRGHVRPGQLNETVDLSTFVAEFATRELDRLGYGGERLLPPAEPLPMPVLKAGLAQLLKNVLTNAVEAISAASPKVARPRIEVTVGAAGARVEISVRDNGPGIEPDLLERLGEPFQTTKEDKGGMGLGLYVSSVLAGRMGGDLRVDTPEGGGTRVTLSLKRAS
jgi:two-component system, sensor histidine kinase RegB